MTPEELTALRAAVAAIPPATLQALATARIDAAMAHVQRAQDELLDACNQLSALCYGASAYKRCGAVRDHVHKLWYVIQAFKQGRKYRLDDTNVYAYAQRQLRTAQEGSGGDAVLDRLVP